MKKTFFIIAVAALILAPSCKKSVAGYCDSTGGGLVTTTATGSSTSAATANCAGESNSGQICSTINCTKNYTCTCVNNTTAAITTSTVSVCTSTEAANSCDALSNSSITCAY